MKIQNLKLVNFGSHNKFELPLDRKISYIVGRNAAGIHYRMDAKFGMELGEEVAISCLKDIVFTYPYSVKVNITKFNGSREKYGRLLIR